MGQVYEKGALQVPEVPTPKCEAHGSHLKRSRHVQEATEQVSVRKITLKSSDVSIVIRLDMHHGTGHARSSWMQPRRWSRLTQKTHIIFSNRRAMDVGGEIPGGTGGKGNGAAKPVGASKGTVQQVV